jgi:hypothetical protein
MSRPERPCCGCLQPEAGPIAIDASIDEGSAGEASSCDCVSTAVSWGYNGGLTAYDDQSVITPCRTYTHTRHTSGNTSDLVCTQDLATCRDPDTGSAQINVVLQNADVQAALAAAPVVYGVDYRPTDGSVFRVQVGNAIVDIGSPCTADAGCRPIPQGIAALRDQLVQLDAQELRGPSCAQVFPSVPSP